MMSNAYTSASELRGVPLARSLKDVEVDGRKFKLQTWTSLESSKWRLRNLDEPQTTNERAIVLSCVDPDGGMLFGEADLDMLQTLPAGFIGRLADACVQHAASEIETKKN
jgi:hypothetical protein